jgi:peptidoglycan hydrolase-like protein with peptidoglycan-binding domain
MKGFPQPISGFFGSITQANLKAYQLKNNLPVTGEVDQDLYNIINTVDKLDHWCLAGQTMEGYFAPGQNPDYPQGSLSWINNNPGNLVYEGQQNACPSNGRFAKFVTYQDGYDAMKNLLIWACTGQTSLYNAQGSLLDFYSVYAPDSDNNNSNQYAEFVAKTMGISVDTIISTLLP